MVGEILWPVLNRRACLQRAVINSLFEIYASLLVGGLRLPFSMRSTEYVKGSPRPYVKLIVLISQKLSGF